MRTKTFLRIGIYVGGILLIILVLGLSLLRQRLYSPTPQDTLQRANYSVGDRLHELQDWPPTPDHPVYPLLMLRDQLSLTLSSDEQKPLLELDLAADRLRSSKILLQRKRTGLALTTLTKSTKYVLSAAADAAKLSPQSSTLIRGEVKNSFAIQIAELARLKQYFSDEQKPVIDGLILQLQSLSASFL